MEAIREHKGIMIGYSAGAVIQLGEYHLSPDEDYADSMGNEFYALVDGSFLRVQNGESRLFGEAYRIKDGQIEPICEKGKSIEL